MASPVWERVVQTASTDSAWLQIGGVRGLAKAWLLKRFIMPSTWPICSATHQSPRFPKHALLLSSHPLSTQFAVNTDNALVTNAMHMPQIVDQSQTTKSQTGSGQHDALALSKATITHAPPMHACAYS